MGVRSLVDGLHEYQSQDGMTDGTMLTVAIEALIEATLEVAKEQRIANAIAVLTIPQSVLDEKDAGAAKSAVTRERVERRNALAATVREGMGLA